MSYVSHSLYIESLYLNKLSLLTYLVLFHSEKEQKKGEGRKRYREEKEERKRLY